MKLLVGIILIVIIAVAGFYFLNSSIAKRKNSQITTTTPTTAVSPTITQDFSVIPISHASMVLTLAGQTIYNDPVGKDQFANQPTPTIILISDIHPDHLNAETLQAVSKESTIIVAPQAVVDQLPKNVPGKITVINNGETQTQNGITITAIPMYNLPQSDTARHTKGRGNGYVIEAGGRRIYIAGDTDDIPEMRALKNIDVAFVPMNPPNTMSVEKAADAVAAFKPKVVHPYHYRTPTGLSDINKFKQLVNASDPNIKVELLDFYRSE